MVGEGGLVETKRNRGTLRWWRVKVEKVIGREVIGTEHEGYDEKGLLE